MYRIIAVIGLLVSIGFLLGGLAQMGLHAPACVIGSAAAIFTDRVAR